jgi:putative transposase
MRLIAQVKLQPNEAQAESLKRTMQATNDAAIYASGEAWANRIFSRVALQKRVYYQIRNDYDLSAQATCLVVRKVADAYKLDKKAKRVFRSLGSIAYDDRILAYKTTEQTVSIWTIDGRPHIPFVCGEHQTRLLGGQRGESDLVYRDGEFYLLATCDVAEQPQRATVAPLGVDLGVKNIAVDSDGCIHSASQVNNVRHRHRRLRQKLQRKGTKDTHRRLKKLSGKERRFATWVNHNISKQIVSKAKDTGRGIALEDLTHIRSRITARRSQRATLHSWSFGQLRAFIGYKAKLAGVSVVLVDPRNTSRTCPCCGHIEKANRKSQSEFLCVSCGFAGHADTIAAGNISRRAAVNLPYPSDADIDFYSAAPGESPRL